jgi:hypothetical protein
VKQSRRQQQPRADGGEPETHQDLGGCFGGRQRNQQCAMRSEVAEQNETAEEPKIIP